MLTATVNGADLHYRLDGPEDGPVVVFSNSLGTDLRVWDDLLALLPAGLRVLRYDKRGHGLSEETPGPYSIETLADDAAALIRHLGLGRVVLKVALRSPAAGGAEVTQFRPLCSLGQVTLCTLAHAFWLLTGDGRARQPRSGLRRHLAVVPERCVTCRDHENSPGRASCAPEPMNDIL